MKWTFWDWIIPTEYFQRINVEKIKRCRKEDGKFIIYDIGDLNIKEINYLLEHIRNGQLV